MTRPAPHSDARGPLDEGVVLAWVEGELSGSEADAVARAVALDPALQDWASAVRRDRAALGGLPEERAPARVMRGVEQALERHVLMAARSGRSGAPGVTPAVGRQEIPVSIVQPPRYTVRERVGDVLASHWFGRGVRLASAAVLVGAAGVGVWIASAWLGTGIPPAGATSPDAEGALHARGLDVASGEATGPYREETLAMATEAGLASALEESLDATSRAAAPLEPPGSLRARGAFGPEPEAELTLSQAVELARSGRLVIRVRTGDPMQGLDAASAIADRLARTRGLHALERDISPALGQVLARAGGVASPVVLAGEEGDPAIRDSLVSAVERTRTDASARPVAAVLVGELDADERGLERVLRVLRQRGGVTLEQAPPGVGVGPALDPGSLLWWSEHPAHWMPRGRIVIVVESD